MLQNIYVIGHWVNLIVCYVVSFLLDVVQHPVNEPIKEIDVFVTATHARQKLGDQVPMLFAGWLVARNDRQEDVPSHSVE